MMTHRQTRLTATSFAAALGAAIVVAALTAPARDEDDIWNLDARVLHSVLTTLGLRDDEKTINYQERSPLVIPPNTALPPPESPSAVIPNNPAWPKDPDVLRAKAEAARGKNDFRTAGEKQLEAQRVLRPDELDVQGKARGPIRPGVSPSAQSNQYGTPLNSQQLGYKGGLFSKLFSGVKENEYGKFTGEQPRTALTEPPPGYQTPSPDQPYGAGRPVEYGKREDFATKRGEVSGH